MLKPKLTTPLRKLSLIIPALLLGACNDDDNSSQNLNENEASTYTAMAQSIVSKMTAEEKINMLIAPGYGATGDAITNSQASVSGTAGWINGVINEEEGIDVPAIRLMDGPAGIRIDPLRDDEPGTYFATTFPSATLLASSWNPNLVREVGAAIGEEAKEYGVDLWLAPGMNIQRNPLAGRNFEYYSEDPLISGTMAASVVNGAQELGVGTTIKHYVANNSEQNRRTVNAVVTPRAMREIYLRGFEYAIKNAQPWALMTSYNSVNGTNVGEREDLVTNIARDEWGFKGLAMSDWWSGWDPVEMIKAGVDVIEPGGAWRRSYGEDWKVVLQQAYADGDLTDEDINDNVVRTITQMLKTPGAQGYAFSNNPDLNAHAVLAKTAAEEGIVLLKNENNALPISTNQTVASFGVGQYATIAIGGGSGSVHSSYITNLVDGLAKQYSLNTALDELYQEAYATTELDGAIDPTDSDYNSSKLCEETTDPFGASSYVECKEMVLTDEQIQNAADTSNVAVITIGRHSSESEDNSAEKDPNNLSQNYVLNDVELSLISRVSDIFHNHTDGRKSVVVVLNVANAIDTAEWKDDVDSILLTYLPGQEAGDAIADIISGTTNPSGKLAQTLPASYASVPSSTTFPGQYEDSYDNEGPAQISRIDYPTDGVVADNDYRDYNQYYNEDVYVGYRYYHTFDVDVSYPFGHGLSYTTFEFGNSAVTANTLNNQSSNGSISLSTTITNVGSYAGKEVAQVYISAPEVKLRKPDIELKAFAKTEELEVNASQQLDFTISAETLASFDDENDQWIVEPGQYRVYIASSSDITGITPITFSVTNEIVVSTTTNNAISLQDKYSDKSFITVSE